MQNRLYINNCANNIGQVDARCPYTVGECSDIGEEYNGKYYSFCDQSHPASTAMNICKNHGGELATPRTVDELTYIGSLAPNRYVMLGWTDRDEEGVWVPTNEEPIWCNGQPNGGTGSNYVRWYTGSTCFDDVGNESRDFICESSSLKECSGFDEWMFTDAQPGVNFPISGGNTRDVALVDLNLDGFLDAIIGNADQRKNVYINNQGNFLLDDGQHWPQFEEDTDTKVDGLHPTDIDGDGDIDVILYSNNKIRIYDNDYMQGGLGALTDVTPDRLSGILNFDGTVNYAARGDDKSISIGDLNGDVLPDIYQVNADHTDYILINQGYAETEEWTEENRVPPGHFEYNTFKALPSMNLVTMESEFADYVGDGDLDLIQCTNVGIRLYDNLGGRFVDRTVQRLPEHSGHCSIKGLEVVDITGDGAVDIYFLTNQNNYGYAFSFINDGTGHFTDQTSVNIPRTHYHWTGLTAIDLDLDNDIDFFYGVDNLDCGSNRCYRSYSYMFINGGDVFNSGGSYFLNRSCDYLLCNTSGYDYTLTRVRAAKANRVNDDIWPDLYVIRNGQNQIFFNPGDTAQFINGTAEYLPAISDNSFDAIFFDSDLDGDLDIYVANEGQDRFLVRESADKFSDITASSLPDSGQVRRKARGLDIADVNGDGLPEIIVANYSQGNSLLTNLGANVFDAREGTLPFDVDYTKDVDFVDFDGDGDIDLFLSNEGQDFFYENKLIDLQP